MLLKCRECEQNFYSTDVIQYQEDNLIYFECLNCAIAKLVERVNALSERVKALEERGCACK